MAGLGQVRCGKGEGVWGVLGKQEKGSRASRGTIQLLMLVPKPLEWKGPWGWMGLVFCVLLADGYSQMSFETHPKACENVSKTPFLLTSNTIHGDGISLPHLKQLMIPSRPIIQQHKPENMLLRILDRHPFTPGNRFRNEIPHLKLEI